MRRSTKIFLTLLGAAGVGAYVLHEEPGSGQPAPSAAGGAGGSNTNATHSSCVRTTGRSHSYYGSRSSSGSRSGSRVSTSTSRGGFGRSSHFSGG